MRDREQTAGNPTLRGEVAEKLATMPRLREMLGTERLFGGLNDDELARLVLAARLTG